MIYFTKYANQKFDILNKHKVYLTRQQIEDVLKSPEKQSQKGKYKTAEKNEIKVIYKKDNKINKIYTFFPVKSTK